MSDVCGDQDVEIQIHHLSIRLLFHLQRRSPHILYMMTISFMSSPPSTDSSLNAAKRCYVGHLAFPLAEQSSSEALLYVVRFESSRVLRFDFEISPYDGKRWGTELITF